MESYIGEIIAGVLAIAGVVAGATISSRIQGMKEELNRSRQAQLKALKCVDTLFTEEKLILRRLEEIEGRRENSLSDEYRELATEETSYNLPYEPEEVKMKIESMEERLE